MTDEQLDAYARAAAQGDAVAFTNACRALEPAIWRYCLALAGDRDITFEAAQETFLRLVPAVRRYRGDGPFRVYSLVIARRCVARVLRRERRYAQGIAADAPPDRPVPGPAGAVELGSLVRALPLPWSRPSC